MPAYRWLNRNPLDVNNIGAHLQALRKVGVPYTDEMIANAAADMVAQGNPGSVGVQGLMSRYGDATTVRMFDGNNDELTEMDAMISYLQILGRLTDIAYGDSSDATGD